MNYITKTTWLGNKYGCRIYLDNILIVEGRTKSKYYIGAVFRDLFRTLDKLGGNKFTHSVRERKYKEGNPVVSCRHYWGGKKN